MAENRGDRSARFWKLSLWVVVVAASLLLLFRPSKMVTTSISFSQHSMGEIEAYIYEDRNFYIVDIFSEAPNYSVEEFLVDFRFSGPYTNGVRISIKDITGKNITSRGKELGGGDVGWSEFIDGIAIVARMSLTAHGRNDLSAEVTVTICDETCHDASVVGEFVIMQEINFGSRLWWYLMSV